MGIEPTFRLPKFASFIGKTPYRRQNWTLVRTFNQNKAADFQ